MENPVRTFDWSAQFDDARQRKPYQNLSKHEACEFAGYLFARAGKDASTDCARRRSCCGLRRTNLSSGSGRQISKCPVKEPSAGELVPALLDGAVRDVRTDLRQFGLYDRRLHPRLPGHAARPCIWPRPNRWPTPSPKPSNFITDASRLAWSSRTGIYWVNSTVNTIRALSLLSTVSPAGPHSPAQPR